MTPTNPYDRPEVWREVVIALAEAITCIIEAALFVGCALLAYWDLSTSF